VQKMKYLKLSSQISDRMKYHKRPIIHQWK